MIARRVMKIILVKWSDLRLVPHEPRVGYPNTARHDCVILPQRNLLDASVVAPFPRNQA